MISLPIACAHCGSATEVRITADIVPGDPGSRDCPPIPATLENVRAVPSLPYVCECGALFSFTADYLRQIAALTPADFREAVANA